MFRRKIHQLVLETEPDFRYRGKESSRMEALSDAVFAFALTLLVVSLEVPKTFDQLLGVFEGFFAFAICGLLLFSIWREHYIFFLRYGLKDGQTIFLNSLLLFMVLFYIYPLKFLFTFFVKVVSGCYLWLFMGDTEGMALNAIFTSMIHPDQIQQLMALYGFGAAGVFFLFAMLYANALKRKSALELNPTELVYTRLSIYQNLVMGTVPFLSAVLASVIATPGTAAFFSGLAYTLYSLMFIFRIYEKRAKAKVTSPADEPAPGNDN